MESFCLWWGPRAAPVVFRAALGSWATCPKTASQCHAPLHKLNMSQCQVLLEELCILLVMLGTELGSIVMECNRLPSTAAGRANDTHIGRASRTAYCAVLATFSLHRA